jgi:hypothetical protein
VRLALHLVAVGGEGDLAEPRVEPEAAERAGAERPEAEHVARGLEARRALDQRRREPPALEQRGEGQAADTGAGDQDPQGCARPA